jgi:hypothetical protein
MVRMLIPVTNFDRLKNRMGYIQAMIDFETRAGKIFITPTQLSVPSCEYASDEKLKQLFQCIQASKINPLHIGTTNFTTLIKFSEYYMIPLLRQYISIHYFQKHPATVAKSILWIKANKNLMEPSTLTLYLQTAADEFGTTIDKLNRWETRQNHLETYIGLKAFLQRARQGKRYRIRWYFTKTCIFCGFVQEFNGKFLPNAEWSRGNPTWLCEKCNDFDLDMHMPD